MTTILTNTIKCNKCEDIITSKHRHDFQYCSCGAIAVDGGNSYLKRTGDIKNYVELSTFEISLIDLVRYREAIKKYMDITKKLLDENCEDCRTDSSREDCMLEYLETKEVLEDALNII